MVNEHKIVITPDGVTINYKYKLKGAPKKKIVAKPRTHWIFQFAS